MNKRDIERVNEPIPNVALLDKVMERIAAEPEGWDQDSWGDIVLGPNQTVYDTDIEPCGTTHCFAGHAAEIAGIAHLKAYKERYTDVDGKPQAFWATQWVDDKGEPIIDVSIQEEARKALGLTWEEADRIFFLFTTDPVDLEILVAEVKLRGQRQQEAFDRIAEELIASVPELADVLKPGYLCPESREVLLTHLRKQNPDA